MKKLIAIAGLSAVALLVMRAQQNTEIRITRVQGKPKLAIPDFRGAGDAQNLMAVFNRMAQVPPVKQADKGTPFRAESLPPYPKDAVAEYKDDQMETPLRAAIDDAREACARIDL